MVNDSFFKIYYSGTTIAMIPLKILPLASKTLIPLFLRIAEADLEVLFSKTSGQKGGESHCGVPFHGKTGS